MVFGIPLGWTFMGSLNDGPIGEGVVSQGFQLGVGIVMELSILQV